MYFLTGNLWLIVALFLLMGKHQVRTEPTMYSFFGSSVGSGWIEPNTYDGYVLFAFGAAAVSFVLAFRKRNKSAESE